MTARKPVVHLTVEDMAARYKVTVNTVYNWRRDGLLPEPIKIGGPRSGTIRWREADIEAHEQSLIDSAKSA